ncbi:hypothetical protein H6P81_019185 [Aristolochia fimbriata]|uniref:Uncharacterized protein n=1 Tax=Aristolochia fimbriata TaxID=158543 RepID=A0AAV7DR28_ARIFI|nr:hypothetical protein H6P81_019185 [Aristolochia fimbriata]
MRTERVITVEYLEPSMSRELLCKFPDPSAFDFDYSQSGIWSPLIPRHHHSISLPSDSPLKKRRRIRDGLSANIFEEKHKNIHLKIGKLSSAKTAKKSSDFSGDPAAGPASAARKGWGNVLFRAATKRFTKRKGSSFKQIKPPVS